MSVTDEIKAKLDIVQYVQQHVPALKKAGRYYKAPCPFHSEKTPSFVVNPDTQSWRCFGACAEGGDLFSFAMKMHGWSFGEALEALGEIAGVEVRRQTPGQRQRSEHLDRLRGMLQTAADFYHQYLIGGSDAASREALHYAREQRGFTDDTIARFQVGYAPPGWQHMLEALQELGYSTEEIIEAGLATHNEDKNRTYDRFRNRLLIPIRDERGRIAGFGARALAPDDIPKYLNSPQSALFDKSHLLFGLDQARRAIRDSGTAVIVEGYMDVIQAHQAGYQNVVAQMGTAMTEAQLQLLVPRYAHRIIMALDADEAGQSATRRSLEVARDTLQADYTGKLSVDIRILQIPGAKDPDDLLRETPEQWPQLVANATPVAEFVINMETASLPSGASLQERQEVARRVLPILTASENNLYTQDNLQKLALRLRITEQDLMAWARELRQIERAHRPRSRSHSPDAEAERSTGHSAEPPLYFPDEPPPDIDDGDEVMVMLPEGAPHHEAPATPAPRPLTSRSSSRAAEAYCLRRLIEQPELLYTINRKLRELAGDQSELLRGPLMEFDADDFSQSDYRALMELLLRAIDQDDMEPIDYMRRQVDAVLAPELESLLQGEPEEMHRLVGHRLAGDFHKVLDKFSSHIRPMLDRDGDLIERVLEVRRQRLQRDREEIRFLQEEARQNHDAEAEVHYARQVAMLNDGWHRVNIALHGGPAS